METYTQDQVNELLQQEKQKWEKEVLQPVQDELAKHKPKEKTDAEKQLEQKQADLLQKEMVLLMKEADVSDFAELISASDAEDLKNKIGKLHDVLKARKVDSSYRPESHKQQSAYDIAEKNNDVLGMIDSKLQKLFN
ncbi:hypothetical protein [Paenibacillus thermotolerans]|uniref:hypothetical protein n=1 Tax=Paenibacillus thermotolerans TaxID=3027807 RepID=UPI002367A73B|nr:MULTISPECIES: hypothetical protein [unclassified Paenibacillus]